MKKSAILEAAPYLVYAALCALTLDHTVDDAYISFRYAENFARGQGLVYNPGEYVEGYSNPLWVYLLSLCALGGLDVVLAAKALSFTAGAATLWMSSRLLERRFGVGTALRHAALLFLAGHVSFVFYTVAGLETVVFACLVLLLHWALVESRHALAATAAGLAAVCRPEGILLLAPLGFGLACSRDRRRALPASLIAIAFVAAQFAFRHAYYGKWWPNTFYAKAPASLGAVEWLTNHTKVFLDGTPGWAYAHLAFGVLGVLALVGAVLHRRVHPPFLLTAGVLFFFIWYSKTDWMAFDRFHVPILPLAVMYGFAALSGMAQRWSSLRQPLLLGAVAAFLVLFSWGATARELQQLDDGETFDPAMSGKSYLAAARHLRELGTPVDLVAAPEIGVIGYVSGLRVLDELGLVHDKIPSLLGPSEYWDRLEPRDLRPYADYVLGHQPRFLILNFEAGYPDNLDPVMRSLYDRMIESDAYVLDEKFRLSSSRELAIFREKTERPGAPQARR